MLEIKNIWKYYKTGNLKQKVLKNISIKFRKNEFVAILGPSGSGKTTLLNIIGGLDCYDKGDLIIDNKSTKDFGEKDWDFYRNNCIGFIFQSYNLINHIDVLANVEMGMTLSGVSRKERRKKAIELLKKVGLKGHMSKRPRELSGGQMQRVAVARALANNPSIILADEPTGALDSETSIQIIELIKKVAKNKLVIMVTHNETLAHKYADRIIELQDGVLVSDSNPRYDTKSSRNIWKVKKTAMNFWTALYLSFNNIKTKKGRTFITVFALAIGLIGISLILSLSNGFNKQIDNFEKNMLSVLPIIISNDSMNMDLLDKNDDLVEDYPSIDYVIPINDNDKNIHVNNIQSDLVNYINKLSVKDVSGINYSYKIKLNLLQKINGKVKLFDTSSLSMVSSIPHVLRSDALSVVLQRFDVLAGRDANNKEELLIEVDSKNRISKKVLEILGIQSDDNISLESLLNKEVTLVLNNDLYNNIGDYFVLTSDLDKVYNLKNAIKLKVVGIIRLKKDYPSVSSGSGLYYTDDLVKYVMQINANSDIVMKQKKVAYNVISGESFDLTTKEGKQKKSDFLASLGDRSIPDGIQIFPTSFEGKKNITLYLDKYNEKKKEEDKIYYVDQANLVSSLSSSIMGAITIVLIAFSSISLIVSSLMLGIIIYISVLERTKEIGILRSLGARKKDISRVFKAETIIIGIGACIVGVLITKGLLYLINYVLKELTGLSGVAVIDIWQVIILLIISLTISLIGGIIPTNIASKKSPVEALR